MERHESVDISELPFYVVVLLVLVAFVVVFLLANRSSRRWLRWPAQGGATIGAILTVFVLGFSVLGEYACTARAPLAYSPDGKHVAVMTWGLQGATGADIASVKIRHRYSPFYTTVYSGLGAAGNPAVHSTDPQVRWLDNRHLLIRYQEWSGYSQICASNGSGIEVVCEGGLSLQQKLSPCGFGPAC